MAFRLWQHGRDRSRTRRRRRLCLLPAADLLRQGHHRTRTLPAAPSAHAPPRTLPPAAASHFHGLMFYPKIPCLLPIKRRTAAPSFLGGRHKTCNVINTSACACGGMLPFQVFAAAYLPPAYFSAIATGAASRLRRASPYRLRGCTACRSPHHLLCRAASISPFHRRNNACL